jgi:hypothetical protein
VSGPNALPALARKYATLVELRRRRDAGGDPAGGGALRALAAEFPGCLRELDTLGLPELERRARLTQTATASGEPREAWIGWIAAYHALMRAALAVRAPAEVSNAVGASLADRATRAAGIPIDPAFIAAALRPPEGRLGIVVFRALAARFAVPASTISTTLFPVRRPSPYSL